MSKLPDLPKARPVAEVNPGAAALEQEPALRVGNREVVTDHYFHLGVADEAKQFQNKVFVRLGARKGTVFRNVSFTHSVFDGCYLANCTFDSCDFTGLVRNFVCEARNSRRGIISEPGGQRSSYGAGLVKRSA